MTEAEWLACSSAKQMLSYLKGRASDRKLRLFAVACCDRITALIDDPRSVAAVRVAEQFADGLATEQWKAAAQAAQQANARFLRSRARPAPGDAARQEASSAASATTITSALLAARRTSEYAAEAARRAGKKDVSKHQARLLRELFGNPFRPSVVVPAVLSWGDGTVRRIAEGIYDERAFDRLPILADALEEAGCTSADMLNHCRQPDEHVRGCWVVDLLLGES